MLSSLCARFGLDTGDNLGNKLAKKGLPNAPLMAQADLATHDARMRIETVHQVKGESLDAVLYVAGKEHVEALLAGVGTEVGADRLCRCHSGQESRLVGRACYRTRYITLGIVSDGFSRD